MRHVGAVEAETSLSALLDLVEKGEEVVITRDGQPVARLVPQQAPKIDREKARRAVEGLLEISRGLSLGGISIKELIEEGRR